MVCAHTESFLLSAHAHRVSLLERQLRDEQQKHLDALNACGDHVEELEALRTQLDKEVRSLSVPHGGAFLRICSLAVGEYPALVRLHSRF